MGEEERENSSSDVQKASRGETIPIEPSFSNRRFSSSGDAKKELFEGFNAWSASISTHGMHTAYAIIAANWAVYGNTQAIMENLWAKYSMGIIILFLGLNLFCTWLMSLCYWERVEYADENKKRWDSEFDKGNVIPSPWPYTEFIERLGKFMRFIKVWAPIIAGSLFILGLFSKDINNFINVIRSLYTHS